MTNQEWAAKTGREEYHEVWKECTILFKDRIEKCLAGTEDNKFKLEYVAEVIEDETGASLPNEYEDRRYIALITAGKNGGGDWVDYLVDAHNIFTDLIDPDIGGFKKAYIVKWENDCADDISYLYLGLK